MIASLAYTLMYLVFGVFAIQWLLPRHRPLNRLWLGVSLGLMAEMVLPAFCAFFFSFTAQAHVAAAAILTAVTFGCYFARDRREAAPWDEEETALLRQLAFFALPLTVIGGYLQYTHTMRADAAGNWHVGQSTYGDLPMHLSFITGLVGKRFPADYPFYPGNRLSYPFLADSLSSTFYLLGTGLQASVILPGTLMMALCFAGVLILARQMTGGRRIALLAALFFFLNGGLGFLYDYDLAGGGTESLSAYFSTVRERTEAILTGYYKTPTNQPDPNNLRWSNVICDLMIPQRTILGGWCMVIPCFYLLDALFRPRVREAEGGLGLRGLLLLGVWAGLLPMVHTHSFLALGLASLGAMIYDLIHGDPKAMPLRRTRIQILTPYLIFAGTALLLAAPQLLLFTFRQTFQGREGHAFLKWQFNWVNNPGGNGMRDLYLWFYIKNIGLPFLMLLGGLLARKPRNMRFFSMALPILLAAELIRFQPNEYDNNKLFYLAWLLCCMIAADWCGDVWRRLRGLPGRAVLAGVAAVVVFLSAGLSLWREWVSDYVAFGRESVEAGEYIRDHTDREAVFITGTEHLNPVCAIGGRDVVCGPDLWLYWHGFDTRERQTELAAFYADPAGCAWVAEKYGADYVYVSSWERNNYDIDEAALQARYLRVFENGEAALYKIQ